MLTQGICKECGKNKTTSKGIRNGKRKYRPVCWSCYKKKQGKDPNGPKKQRFHKSVKGTTCEKCGFVAEHPCQLDIDHKNGDHDDNHPENLWTLCANCHRLKTWKNKDWKNKKKIDFDCDLIKF